MGLGHAMMENETTELKTSLAELKQGLISLVAMLNKHGQAELWFGIAPHGHPVGLELNDKTLRDVSQAVAAHIEPRIYPQITRQTVAGKPCLRIQAHGQHGPYFAHGRAYIRVADEDRQMSARALETLILRRNRAAMRWDNEPAGLPLQALNEAKIRHFVNAADLPWDNTHNVLEKLGLLHDGQPVNAARLFFADAPIELRCAVFAAQTSATIIDRHDFTGDILELIGEAQKYILKNIHIGMRLEGLHRVDVPEISSEALREAVINAFCHRDWRDPDYIQIAIYKDRVEIRNPGGLYDDLTLEDLHRGGVSRRRNPLIAELLRRIHLIEAWGRGMPLILENAPDAAFCEVAGLFVASFARPTALQTSPHPSPDTLHETTPKPHETTPKPHETTPKPHKTTPKTQETSRKRQGNTQATLCQILRQQPRLSAADLAQAIGLSINGIKYHLDQLKRTGKLRHHGPTRGGYWEVTDP